MWKISIKMDAFEDTSIYMCIYVYNIYVCVCISTHVCMYIYIYIYILHNDNDYGDLYIYIYTRVYVNVLWGGLMGSIVEYNLDTN